MGASPLSLWREMEASSKRWSLLSSWLQSGEQSCAVGFQLPAEIIPAPLAVPNLLSGMTMPLPDMQIRLFFFAHGSRGHMPPLHSIALLVAFTRCTSNPTSFAL